MKNRESPAWALIHGNTCHLSNHDLLAILIGGDATSIQEKYPSLVDLEQAPPTELEELLGHAPTSLLAAREISRRTAEEKVRRGTPVLSAEDAYQLLHPLLRGEKREVVLALALDTKSRLTCPPITISVGTISSAPVHPREIFRPLIREAASSCILAHLHPSSGEPIPSPEDIMFTARLREAADLLGIPLVDHLVLGNGCYLSMSSRGLL